MDCQQVGSMRNSEKQVHTLTDEAKKLIDSIFSAHNLDELYDSTRTSESDNRVILKDIDDNYPKLLKEGNLASVLEAAKRKKDIKSQ